MDPSKYGHWVVAGKSYKNKLEAVTQAVPNGWWPHFYFREDEFSSHDWTVEPDVSLESLYFARARQLRAMYDHITIEYSGGVDSWYILYSFVAQGLHVDVVNHRFIEAAAQGTRDDLSAKNTSAEGKYQAYPWFEKFKELVPTMTWNDYNATDIVVKGWTAGSLDPFKYNRLHTAMMTRVPGLAFDPYNNINASGRSAIIHGVDKPNLYFQDGKFYAYFPDHTITGSAASERAGLLNGEDVFFYYDPDCCDLLIKQAHMIMKWFKNNSHLLSLISNRHYRNNTLYNQILNALVYPKYVDMWQTEKPYGLNFLTSEEWFHKNYLDSTAGKNWLHSVQTASDIIDRVLTNTEFEQYIKKENNFSTLAVTWSKFYYVGSL
jgi:hypothetical protein